VDDVPLEVLIHRSGRRLGCGLGSRIAGNRWIFIRNRDCDLSRGLGGLNRRVLLVLYQLICHRYAFSRIVHLLMPYPLVRERLLVLQQVAEELVDALA
jgi:hypothetical protein